MFSESAAGIVPKKGKHGFPGGQKRRDAAGNKRFDAASSRPVLFFDGGDAESRAVLRADAVFGLGKNESEARGTMHRRERIDGGSTGTAARL